MKVTYTVDDGYVNQGRRFTCEVNDQDIRDAESDSDALDIVATVIEEHFQQHVMPGYNTAELLDKIRQVRAKGQE